MCLCAKIIDLLLGDPHLSSINDGRGAPVGCMFQMEEREKKDERKPDICLFPRPVFDVVTVPPARQAACRRDTEKNDDCSVKQRSSLFISTINHTRHLH